MVMKIDDVICNTETAIPLYTHERTTTEQLTPRVTLVKTELPYHPRYKKDFWFSHVTVQKYIDNNLVKTYSWLQSITQEEKEEFLKINNKKKSPTTLSKKRREYMKEYYQQHKDKCKEYCNTPEYKEKKKKYREEHKEEYRENSRQYYQLHREEKLKKVKEYQRLKKLNIN